MKYTQKPWMLEAENLGCKNIVAYIDGEMTEIACTSGLSDEEEDRGNAVLVTLAPEMFEALCKISEGRGRYSMDPLYHAGNTIEDMKKIAVDVVSRVDGYEEIVRRVWEE